MSDSFGPYRINPAFDRFPEEAQLIGKLLSGFGEIEYQMCSNAAYAAQMPEMLRALYRLRATSSRIDVADTLGERHFRDSGLAEEYQISKGMVFYCRTLRNVYSHCHWADADVPVTDGGGLYFTDLAYSANAPTGFEHIWKHVNVSLLESQELYYSVTLEWLRFLYHELRAKRGSMPQGAWPKPPQLERPIQHNPLWEHAPPWLNEDERIRHEAFAQAARVGAPTPTAAHLAMEAERRRKRAGRQADRDRSARARSTSEPEK